MKTTVARIITASLLTIFSGVTLAHHSMAMFDPSKKVTITGKVSEVQWTNPHVWIFVDVPKPDGTAEKWGVEFTSKVHLARRNFSPDMIKVGDDVEFVVSPYFNGKPGGRFYTVKLDNGEYYCDVGAAQAVCNPPAAAKP
jgi:hypothetical protein